MLRRTLYPQSFTIVHLGHNMFLLCVVSPNITDGGVYKLLLYYHLQPKSCSFSLQFESSFSILTTARPTRYLLKGDTIRHQHSNTKLGTESRKCFQQLDSKRRTEPR
jgi:hypothetical protein